MLLGLSSARDTRRKPANFGSVRLRSGGLATSCTGFWIFNETGGLTTYDLSRGRNSGTLTNGPSWAVGQPGSYVQFTSGASTYISLPNGGGLDGLAASSIVMRARWRGTQSAGPYNAYGAISGRQYNSVFSNHIVCLTGTDPATAALSYAAYGVPMFGGTSINCSTAVGDSKWRTLGITTTSGSHVGYLDGLQDGTGGSTGSYASDAAIPWTVGGDIGDVNTFATGDVAYVMTFNRILSSGEMMQLHVEPFSLLDSQPRKYWFTAGAAAAYTLAVATGTFTLTGNAVGLLAARKITVALGTFTLTGQAVGLFKGYKATVAVGTFTLTGQAVNLLATRTVPVASGSFTLTGQAINLLKGRTATVAAGSFTLTGYSVNLLAGRTIAAAKGTFTLSGQAVILNKGVTLTAGLGTFTLTGQSINLPWNHVLAVAKGTFVLTGQAANLLRGRTLAIGVGSFTLTGQAVLFARGRGMVVATGSYTFTGNSINLLSTRTLALAKGTFVLTGVATTLVYSRAVVAGTGTFVLTGRTVGLRLTRRLSMGLGTYVLTGRDVGLTTGIAAKHFMKAKLEYHSRLQMTLRVGRL